MPTSHQQLDLDHRFAKVYGIPTGITSNLAYDKYQGLLAMGTGHGMIKIVSLKGFE